MTPSVPMPESSDRDSVQRWMRQVRDVQERESRDSPTTPEEFAEKQRNRLLRAVELPLESGGRRRIDVALTGRATDDHVVHVSTLGSFLSNLQESISAIAQALAGRPTNSASIPRDIRDATALSAAATFPSSFGVVMFGPPVDSGEDNLFGDQIGDLPTILDEAVEKMLHIVDLSEGEGLSDELLTEQLAPLGPRSIKHISALAAGLNSAEVGMRVSWYARSGQVRRSSWSAPGVQRVRYLCEHSEFGDVETVSLTGWLGSASSFRGTVEIRKDNGEIIQAGTGEELAAQLERYFNKRVEADVEVTKVQFAGGRERRMYSILRLRNL
jgi:hypothetical protein